MLPPPHAFGLISEGLWIPLVPRLRHDQVLESICEAARATPVMMGVSGARPSLVAARRQGIAKRFAVEAFLLPAPSYIRPSQLGLLHFFGSIAGASPRPLVLYTFPAAPASRSSCRPC